MTTATSTEVTSSTIKSTLRTATALVGEAHAALDKIFWFWPGDVEVAQKFFEAVAAGRIRFTGTLSLLPHTGTPASDIAALRKRCAKFSADPEARAALEREVLAAEFKAQEAAAAAQAATAALEADPQNAKLAELSEEAAQAAKKAQSSAASARKAYINADELLEKFCLALETALAANEARRAGLFAWLEGEFHDDTRWTEAERLVVYKALRPAFTYANTVGRTLYVVLDTDLNFDIRGDATRTKRCGAPAAVPTRGAAAGHSAQRPLVRPKRADPSTYF